MCRDYLFKFYLDLSRCYLKQLKSPQAITFCKKMLKLKPNCTLGIYQNGTGLP